MTLDRLAADAFDFVANRLVVSDQVAVDVGHVINITAGNFVAAVANHGHEFSLRRALQIVEK